ncbi:unnamed protein product (macronuclear) [Paramecium tetraurelia]|uniref:Uncharacterized protein n=1 Tax=Paramecium tetraurelia TaxID=5888 RepID=A0CJY7_PARTE|nr:uncharacterized protein GSPATT00000816001 [Paramecium tetraurelia]CAK71104.1 unnamed protein product [Paramecium tetraurelia]|eukprot:XP_001438501.1 hypothetical protein (macronuclear) [Paramecium tetraurelia strain d4-2]
MSFKLLLVLKQISIGQKSMQDDLNNIYAEKYSMFPRVSSSDQMQIKQYFDISFDESDSEVCCQNDVILSLNYNNRNKLIGQITESTGVF